MKFRFSKSKKIKSLDAVPKEFHSFYEEVDGEFVLQESHTTLAGVIDGLNDALDKSREDTKQAKAAAKVDLSALSEYGETPEEISEAVTTKISELTEAVEKGSKINPEKIKEQVAKSYESKIAEAERRTAGYRENLFRFAVEREALDAISKHGGKAKLLMPHLKSRVKLEEEEVEDEAGNKSLSIKVNVIDGAGQIEYGTDGHPMSVAGLVESLKDDDDFSAAFASTAPSGGGTPPSRGPQPGPRTAPAGKDAPPAAKISEGLRERARRNAF